MRIQKAIRNFDLEAYIRNNFDPVVEASGGSELRVNCFSPLGCAGTDHKQHLWINPEKKVWICYKCGYGDHKQQQGTGRVSQFIADNEGISTSEVLRRLGEQVELTPAEELGDLLSDLFNEEKKGVWTQAEVVLPDSFVRYKLDAYAKRRGLTETLLAKHRVLRCTDAKMSKWRDRLIFPIYSLEGKLISAVGRAVSDKKKPRWRNWPNSDLQQCLWPLGEWERWNGGKRRWFPVNSIGPQVVLVEGVFDVIGVSKAEYSAVCSFGHKLSNRQIATLQRMGVQEVVLAWDADSQARMVDAAQRLVGRVEQVSVFPFNNWPEDKDFGDIVGNKALNDLFITELVGRIPVESSEFLQWAAKAKMKRGKR